MTMSAKQLTRSRDKKLMGVAGGIAEYLDMDPTVWRAIWVFASIMMPPLVVAYIVLGLVVPDSAAPVGTWRPVNPPWPTAAGPQPPVAPVAPAPVAPAAPTEEVAPVEAGEGAQPAAEALGQDQPQYQAPNQGQYQAPNQGQYQAPNQGQYQGERVNSRDAYRPLTKSRDRWISGVCGGIAHYFGIDPVIIRALWLASIFFFGTGIFLYIVLAILMPGPVDQTRF
jgi:phage shock protein C